MLVCAVHGHRRLRGGLRGGPARRLIAADVGVSLGPQEKKTDRTGDVESKRAL